MASSQLIRERFLLKVRLQVKREFYPNQIGQAVRTIVGSYQLAESFFYAEFMFYTIQRSTPRAFRQFPPCVAIENSAVARDHNRITEREVATFC